MKKALLTLAVVLTSVSVFAQGTVVFNNLGGKAVKWAPGTPKAGQNVTRDDGILVQLLWLGDGTAAPTPVGAPVGEVPTQWPLAGVFNGGQRQVETANTADPGWTWQIRAWALSFGTDWQASYAASDVKQINAAGEYGGTVQFQSKTGDPVASISPQGMAGSIPEFTIGVPEPSVIGLGVLGVGALLLLRRRS